MFQCSTNGHFLKGARERISLSNFIDFDHMDQRHFLWKKHHLQSGQIGHCKYFTLVWREREREREKRKKKNFNIHTHTSSGKGHGKALSFPDSKGKHKKERKKERKSKMSL